MSQQTDKQADIAVAIVYMFMTAIGILAIGALIITALTWDTPIPEPITCITNPTTGNEACNEIHD